MSQIEIISCIADKLWVNDVINAGADALYCGVMNKSWFNNHVELSWEELLDVSKIVHKFEKKIYLAINRNLSTEDIDEVMEYLKFFENGTFDGIILSDWGCINAIRKKSQKVNIHLSANAGCVNEWDFKFAEEMNVQRVIFSPSLELEYMSGIIKKYKKFEWEAISYGVQCINEVGFCPCHTSFNQISIDNVCCHNYVLHKNDDLESEAKPFGNKMADGTIAKELYKLGVKHFKLEGRARGLKHIIDGTRKLRSIADEINGLEICHARE